MAVVKVDSAKNEQVFLTIAKYAIDGDSPAQERRFWAHSFLIVVIVAAVVTASSYPDYEIVYTPPSGEAAIDYSPPTVLPAAEANAEAAPTHPPPTNQTPLQSTNRRSTALTDSQPAATQPASSQSDSAAPNQLSEQSPEPTLVDQVMATVSPVASLLP